MKVLAFPSASNKYQELLYSRFPPDTQVKVIGATWDENPINVLIFIFSLLAYKRSGYSIFHLHWFFFLKKPPSSGFYRWLILALNYLYAWLLLRAISFTGFRLVYTVHNVTPHEPLTINDAAITRLTLRLADAVICHSADTINQLRAIGAYVNKCHLIPHGAYPLIHAKNISRKESRRQLQLPQNVFMFLFLGWVREYKGVLPLISTYSRIALKHKNTILVIAGKCSDQELCKEIIRKSKDLNVVLRLEYVPEHLVPLYYSATNVAVFPHRKITTSGSVIEAFSYGVPAIFPDLGNLKEVPEGVGIKYDPNSEDGLYNAMEQAILHENLSSLGEREKAYVAQFNWEAIAKKTHALFLSLRFSCGGGAKYPR
ncbi:MAG: glycosyltransferase family 4 protein [Patescibacteria group bacterium]|nr:glycosyltransferase family 4 protein [Patescibacteria group bacterium]